MTVSPGEHDPFPNTTLHVRGACTGTLASVDWIVRRFTPVLLAQARYRLRGRMASICDPEDVVNDVWLTVLPKLHHIRPRAGRYTPVLVAYLATTTLNRVNSLVAKHLRGKQKSTDYEVADVPAETMTVVSRAVRCEEQDAVLTAIEALPEADREVLILGAIEQRPRSQIAATLQTTEGAVRVRLHRAIKRLKAQLPGGVFAELVDDADAEDSRPDQSDGAPS